MENTEIRVHQSHCCALHGCKYGDKDCPVIIRLVIQTSTCDSCDEDGISRLVEVGYKLDAVTFEGTVVYNEVTKSINVIDSTEELSEILETKYKDKKVRITIEQIL
jgi:hypothetical protein